MGDDVVVVGSGAAALSAALSAAVRGARVTVLERAGLFGGTSAISGGGMWLPGNGLDPDFTDSADDARRYVRHLTLGLVDDRVIDRYVREAAGIVPFLSAHTVLSFWTMIGRPDYHADYDGGSGTSRTVFSDTFDTALLRDLKPKLRRPHWPGGIPPLRGDEVQQFIARGDPDGWKLLVQERMAKGIVLRGCALVGGLLEACLRNGVRLSAQTRARELMMSGGRVTGVRATRDGSLVEFGARQGVVLASGGFEWNRELWDALLQIPWDGPASPPNNEGDAHRPGRPGGPGQGVQHLRRRRHRPGIPPRRDALGAVHPAAQRPAQPGHRADPGPAVHRVPGAGGGVRHQGRAGDQLRRADRGDGRDADPGVVRRRERGGQHLRRGVPGWRGHPGAGRHLRLCGRPDAHVVTLCLRTPTTL